MKSLFFSFSISLILTSTMLWCGYKADADMPPPQIREKIFEDISTICEGYPYKVNSVWYEFQQSAWENQGKFYIPHVEELNKFCKSKGY